MPSDLCARCDHAENSHVPELGTSQTVCQGCLIAIERKAHPRHRFEEKHDRQRTYLQGNARVSALPVGSDFVLAGGTTLTVYPPCDNYESGFWVCTTHLFRFRDNQGKDFHCFIGKQAHALTWYCSRHDRCEYAGV